MQNEKGGELYIRAYDNLLRNVCEQPEIVTQRSQLQQQQHIVHPNLYVPGMKLFNTCNNIMGNKRYEQPPQNHYRSAQNISNKSYFGDHVNKKKIIIEEMVSSTLTVTK